MSHSEPGPGSAELPVDRSIDPQSRARLAWAIPIALVLAFWSFAFPSLDQYNVTWDEALGDFFFGERYLSFFGSLDARYLDFQAEVYPPGHQPELFRSPFKGRPWEYYPFANTAAAASSEVLSRQLGLLDPFDGFHAVNLLFAAVLIVAGYRFLHGRYGMLVAASALGFLFGSPRVIAHAMANIKDFPLMVLYALTAMAFYRAWESGSERGLLGAGVCLGLTLATKANGLFFPLLPAFLWLSGGTPEPWRGRRLRLFGVLVAAGALSVVVMVALWPYLWLDPVGHFAEHLRYIAFRKGFTSAESVAPVLEAISFTTPTPFLLFFALGCATSVPALLRRDRRTLFLFAWMAAVLFRYLLPQSVNFDGVRHFLELFPAMAVVAGLGAARAARFVVDRVRQRRGVPSDALATDRRALGWRAVLAMATLLPGIWAVLLTHPFQLCYWNGLVGGYAGARQANLPQASDYWATSYRLGLRWLVENAEPDAYLAVPVVEHAVRLVAPQRLRDDITLLPITTPFSPRIAPERLRATVELAREHPLYVMFVERRDWMNVLMADCLQRLEPETAWYLDGETVLAIYRYEPPPARPLPPGVGAPAVPSAAVPSAAVPQP